jgi:hypothetical protein
VAISASAIGCATTPRLVLPADAIPWNAITMPHTVPNKPMNGVMLAVVARNGTRCSSLFSSTALARRRALSTASRLFSVGRAAGVPGLAGSLLSVRSCVFSSAYPD